MHVLLVGLGGFLGAIARYGCGLLVQRIAGGTPIFPYATLLVNVAGSFLIGLGAVLILSRVSASAEWRLFLLVGLLGALTTFSTFSLETLELLYAGRSTLAVLNILTNVGLCLLAVLAGSLLGRLLA